MSMNPAMIMKLMGAKAQLEKDHPMFMNFLKTAFSRPIEEDTIIDIVLTRPGEEPIRTNLKVKQSDLDLLKALGEISK